MVLTMNIDYFASNYNQLICIINTACVLCDEKAKVFNANYTNVSLRSFNEALLNLFGVEKYETFINFTTIYRIFQKP
jgi:hypothetical protein